MSEFHSENNDNNLGLTVRIKLVDLNYASKVSDGSSRRKSAGTVSTECLSAIVGLPGERTIRPASKAKPPRHDDCSNAEVCMLTGNRIPVPEFEAHIETCPICANRVELQLDFIEALEVAVYQRKTDPDSKKVHGAMLISVPELNFAVCGELEIV